MYQRVKTRKLIVCLRYAFFQSRLYIWKKRSPWNSCGGLLAWPSLFQLQFKKLSKSIQYSFLGCVVVIENLRKITKEPSLNENPPSSVINDQVQCKSIAATTACFLLALRRIITLSSIPLSCSKVQINKHFRAFYHDFFSTTSRLRFVVIFSLSTAQRCQNGKGAHSFSTSKAPKACCTRLCRKNNYVKHFEEWPLYQVSIPFSFSKL
jgi:hypothetical protein